jgi:hypothetical protein
MNREDEEGRHIQAGFITANAKVLKKLRIDTIARMLYFFVYDQLRGSFGSSVGCGTRGRPW